MSGKSTGTITAVVIGASKDSIYGLGVRSREKNSV